MGACVAAALAALGAILPAASKTTSTLPPGKTDEAVLGRARLLASHGEPRLALSTLRAHEFDSDNPAASRLTMSLMAELGQPATAESLLTAANRRAEDAAGRFRTQLVRARLLLDAERYPAAISALSSIDTMTSPYAGYRDLVLARALVGAGDRESALRALERARKHAPEAIFDEVDQERIDLYRALGRTREALAAAIDAAAQDGDSDARRRVLAIRFELAGQSGETRVAQDAARDLFEHHRRSEEARDCAREIAHSDRDRFDAAFLFSCASTLQAHSLRDPMRTVLRDLDKRELSAAQSEQLRLLWSEFHYMGGDYSRAIALARPSYDDPGLRRRSMLVMARSYKRVGRSADAATTYEAYARAYPNDALAAEALYTAAALYEQIDRDADRVRVLDELRHAYPSTFHGWAASMVRAKEFEADGRHDDATAIFDQWLTRSRRTDEAALFYSSRQRRSAGDEAGSDALLAELRAVNPYSFYARPDLLLPGTRLPKTGPLDSWLTDATKKRNAAIERVEARMSKSERPRAGAEVAGALERGRFFLSVGFRDWAERELDVARRRAGDSPADALALARLFDEHAMPWRSVRLYEKTRGSIPWKERRESADDFRYLTHPVPFPVQVMTAAQREGIAPHVIYGMMREESCFDTDVVSRAGAVGLMQLMPGTAREIARRLDLEPGAGDRLGDPVVNVSIGSWYAADLLREGDGSIVWMLAAYNAGPRAARRWIDAGTSGESAIDAVESIDYKETRGYVKRVVESANVYQSLYFEGAATSGPR
jgi:soluble lytic murein transglycosylase